VCERERDIYLEREYLVDDGRTRASERVSSGIECLLARSNGRSSSSLSNDLAMVEAKAKAGLEGGRPASVRAQSSVGAVRCATVALLRVADIVVGDATATMVVVIASAAAIVTVVVVVVVVKVQRASARHQSSWERQHTRGYAAV